MSYKWWLYILTITQQEIYAIFLVSLHLTLAHSKGQIVSIIFFHDLPDLSWKHHRLAYNIEQLQLICADLTKVPDWFLSIHTGGGVYIVLID